MNGFAQGRAGRSEPGGPTMKPSATFTMLVTVALGGASLVATAGPATPAAAAGPVSLSRAFDNVGITSAAQYQGGNLDGPGDSFGSAALARDAITPGGSLVHDGLTINWPTVSPGRPDNVVADGQVIALNGKGNTLGVAATSTG